MIRRTILGALAVPCLALSPCFSAALSGDSNTGDSAPTPPGNAPILGIGASPAELLPAWLQVSGQIRGRFESPSGSSLLNRSKDSYYLSRMRIDLGIKPTSWLRFFAEAQDARTGAYNLAPAPATLYNPMDLRQGYVELGYGHRVKMQLRAGRQDLVFGGERLIGPSDWGMSRTFDALDLTVTHGVAKVDFLAGSPVQIDSTRFDRHKPGEHFYGAYGSVKAPRGMTIEPYVLFKQNLLIKSEDGRLGDALVVSPGVRIAGKAGRFDYTTETVAQRGSYSSDSVRAHAASGVLGWTVSSATWKPRVSVEGNYASGDGGVKDGRRGTFDQFYPTNHLYYGMIDQFGWKNLENYRAGFDFMAARKLKVRADFNEFYLATAQDGLYSSAGSSIVLNRNATSKHIGSEWNATALYQWTKIWKFGAGFGRLYAGDYLKQSKYSAAYTYPYLMFVGSF
jgi:hypothetical protein